MEYFLGKPLDVRDIERDKFIKIKTIKENILELNKLDVDVRTIAKANKVTQKFVKKTIQDAAILNLVDKGETITNIAKKFNLKNIAIKEILYFNKVLDAYFQGNKPEEIAKAHQLTITLVNKMIDSVKAKK